MILRRILVERPVSGYSIFMKKTVLYLGNPVLGSDSKPLQLIPLLQKKFPQINFLHYDPTEELPEATPDQDLIIIDTVIGITKVQVMHHLDNLSLSPRNSVHDFDLVINLKLMKKLGKIKGVKIIGIPAQGDDNEIIKRIEKLMGGMLRRPDDYRDSSQ